MNLSEISLTLFLKLTVTEVSARTMTKKLTANAATKVRIFIFCLNRLTSLRGINEKVSDHEMNVLNFLQRAALQVFVECA